MTIKNTTIGILGGIFLLPLLYLLVGSLATNWRFPALLPEHFTTMHWLDLLSNKDWIWALTKSIVLSAAVALSGVILGLVTARGLSRDPLHLLWLRLCYLPYGLSPVLYAYSMQYYYHKTGLAGSWSGVYLAQLILVYPFAVVLFFTYFNEKLHALEETAVGLGANLLILTKTVTLPLLRKPIQTISIQLFLISWFDYGISSVIGVGRVKTLTLLVYQYIGESNLFYAALASCIMVAPPLFLWLFHRTSFFNPASTH